MTQQSPHKRRIYTICKRLFDILLSLVLLALSSPIWLIAIIGIKCSSPGPLFYIAQRVGKDGKLFSMFKFRSMHVNKSANEKGLRPDQDRIFKFGEFMRSTKIDELPQLLNVFLGHMSIVGPRPAAKDQILITRSGKYQTIYAVQVGLASPSSLYDYIYGDEIVDEEEYKAKVLRTRLDLELYYLAKRCLLYDLKMVLYTVVCISTRILHIKPWFIYHELLDAARKVRENTVTMESAATSVDAVQE
jgi:lipopolysaccharide/colanic/teichoic acid biosynthesis glycosyltransferase